MERCLMVTTDDANKIWEAIEGLRKELRDFTAGDGTDDRPGFAIRIDRLEQSAKVRLRMIYLLMVPTAPHS